MTDARTKDLSSPHAAFETEKSTTYCLVSMEEQVPNGGNYRVPVEDFIMRSVFWSYNETVTLTADVWTNLFNDANVDTHGDTGFMVKNTDTFERVNTRRPHRIYLGLEFAGDAAGEAEVAIRIERQLFSGWEQPMPVNAYFVSPDNAVMPEQQGYFAWPANENASYTYRVIAQPIGRNVQINPGSYCLWQRP